jgi:hypothetical protein
VGPSYQSFTDPTEGAFTAELPEGWTTEGAITRPCPTLTQGYVRALSPENDQFIKLGNDYPWFTLPAFGLPEGGTYPHPCGYQSPVAAYLRGAQFVTDYLLPSYYNNAEIIEVRDRSDVAASLGAVGFQSFDAGEVEYRYTSEGETYHGVALVVTELLQTDIGGAWDVWRLVQAEATEERFADAVGHALHMTETFRIDESWALGQEQMTREQSQIIADMNDSISSTISEGYWGRQATYDAIFERRADADLQVEDFVDPVTGQSYELESGPEYYWIDPSGTIVGTDTSVAPTIDFRELLHID